VGKDLGIIVIQSLGMIVIPVLFSFPAMLVTVPPLVELLPAMLPLGIEVTAAVFGLAAVVATMLNGFVQSGLGLFDGMLAL